MNEKDNYCFNCGAHLNPDDTECGKCHIKLQSDMTEKSQNNNFNMKILFLISVSIVSVIILILIFIKVTGENKDSDDKVLESNQSVTATTEIQEVTTIETSTEVITEALTEAETEALTEKITEEEVLDYYKIYKSTVESAAGRSIDDSLEYYLFDIDSDGIDELIVQEGDTLAESACVVYTIRDGISEYLGAIEGSNSGELSYDGKQLYYNRMLQGFQMIYKVNKIGNEISSELMFENEVSDGYSSYGTVLVGCPLGDDWLLKGEAMPEEEIGTMEEDVVLEQHAEAVAWIVTEEQSSGVNLRREPELNDDNIITVIPNGSMIDILDTEGDWYYVYYNSECGYVSADYVSFEEIGVSENNDDYYVATADDFTYKYSTLEGVFGATQGIRIDKYISDENHATVEIPSYIEGFPVTVIGADCFDGRTEITGLIIPYTVTTISARGVWGMPNLTALCVAADNPTFVGAVFDENQDASIVCIQGSGLHSQLINSEIPYIAIEE